MMPHHFTFTVALPLCISLVKTCVALAVAKSSIASYAALGDSYAAGDGAGSPLPTCARFTDAYPIQVANDTRLSIPPDHPWYHHFRNLPCGGASTTSVLHGQIPWIGDADIVSITAGGNEVEFFSLLNDCVFQWRPSSTCEAAMARVRSLVQSTALMDRFEEMVKGAIRRMKPDARLLVTGYAAFFNEYTSQCDRVSFSQTDPVNVLSKKLRRELNGMVRLLNDLVKGIVEAHERALYVDVDRVFEGHRFCEEGVVEPDTSRADTWFFNVHFDKSSNGAADLGSPRASADEETAQKSLPGPIRDFYDLTKTFHPTSLGHKAIANEFVKMILEI